MGSDWVHGCILQILHMYIHTCTCMMYTLPLLHMYIHVHTCMYMYTTTITHVYTYIHVHVCIGVLVHVCTTKITHVYTCICTSQYMYAFFMHSSIRVPFAIPYASDMVGLF